MDKQIKEMANEIKEMVKHTIKIGIVMNLEIETIFNTTRDKLNEMLGLSLQEAASLFRICLDEVVFETTGKHQYTKEQMDIICSKGLAG